MKKADSEFIKGRIAPCGLHCGKCFAFADGDISYHSNELKGHWATLMYMHSVL